MSTDHYAAAVEDLQTSYYTDDLKNGQSLWRAQCAQVHATLALVDAIRALADQQVQVDIEDDGTFQLRGIAVRRGGAA